MASEPAQSTQPSYHGGPVGEDSDPEETREWLDALQAVLEREGPERAHFLLERLVDKARRTGAHIPFTATTAYVNTIPPAQEAKSPGDAAIEWRIRSLIRWNALAMVVQANRHKPDLGGHIASFASSATLYDVGFNHFFRGPEAEHGPDLVYIQGHSAPGIYARAFLEGRLEEDDLHLFRQEALQRGLSSYPHPWLQPDFWQFPTVSMGLGPLMAIYQARFMKYLANRGLKDMGQRKVWCFTGDGEMDEPESIGGLSLAAREQLDNLIMVVNCNLQRLDGPVRGNGKIIQELEGLFRGAGWNVIKVIWGSYWDPLLARDTQGFLLRRMEEAVDGEYQAYKAKGGAYTRQHFFGKYPELLAMVANMTDEDIWRLNRGGHDPHKIYAAYAEAIRHTGQPTVILAKTVKGYGMGEAGEGQNITHQQKKLGDEALRHFRDRFNIPIPEEDVSKAPFYRPPQDSPEYQYIKARREALGGFLPLRRQKASQALTVPPLKILESAALRGTGERQVSTTMVFGRILAALVRDHGIGRHVVPIIPDEARTFGMEGLFRQLGIYSMTGQLYVPEDRDELAYYREAKDGQILEEGITEAGAFCSWVAAATAYSNHDLQTVPFFIFYSMFGFQRIGDFAWAAGDARSRGFLLGGTAGRTTLAGEGLQHQDGHSLLLSSVIPNCISYDPCFGYELAVIIHHGLKRMLEEQHDEFYYITLMNEDYPHPPLPEGVEEGIVRGLYRLRDGRGSGARVRLLGCGTILRQVLMAGDLLEERFGIAADVFSVTSFTELRREAMACDRQALYHPEEPPPKPYVTAQLEYSAAPIIAASDYLRTYSDQIRAWVPGRYVTLGTDGFGRSDGRAELRTFFEVDAHHIAWAALKTLHDEGAISGEQLERAQGELAVDRQRPAPWTV